MSAGAGWVLLVVGAADRENESLIKSKFYVLRIQGT